MELLEWMSRLGHDRITAVQDSPSGLRAWIAIHQLRFGRAYGGVRIWHYRNETEAAIDALRLSHAMTTKCVLAGVEAGGARTVVLADSIVDRQKAMQALGCHIEAMGGVYRAGPDIGFRPEDQKAVSHTTQWLTQFGVCKAQPFGHATAEGAEWAIRSALLHAGLGDLAEATVSIQGMGAVGKPLVERLLLAGAKVIAADLDPIVNEWAKQKGVEVKDPAEVLFAEADVVVPAALGGVLHDLSIPKLRCKIVAPVANNALANPEHANLLAEHNILYVPDFVMNSGALIQGAGFDATGEVDWSSEIRQIGETVSRVLEASRRDGVTSLQAAEDMAQKILTAEAEAKDEDDVEGSEGIKGIPVSNP